MEENKKCCENCVKDEELEKLLCVYKQDKDNLIQILSDIQEHYGYIPAHAVKAVSEYLNVPTSEIYGIITFYKRFTIKPKGKYHITVCLGNTCYKNGSRKIMDRLEEKLGIKVGETTKDGKFSIEEARCFGLCGKGPVFTINEEVHVKATVQELDKILNELNKKM